MELSNEELYECFQNYHRALYDDFYRDPGQMVLTLKSSKEQQQVRHRGILLEDDVMLRETTVFDDGYLLLDMMSEKSGSEEFTKVEEIATTEENGAKNEDVLVEKGKEKAPVMELAKKSNLGFEIAKQAGEIHKFPIQEEAVVSDAAKLKEAEDGYTVSTMIDGHKLHMNPHSVLPRSGSSVLSFNVLMVVTDVTPKEISPSSDNPNPKPTVEGENRAISIPPKPPPSKGNVALWHQQQSTTVQLIQRRC
ncbi:hypothetical protein F2P56_024344 [Juglans regia]|uniref:Uncharacterized protein n=2 Tax=Juglans regia TaxID=51240 RepID=A0A833UBT5_JUGRE|nr:uncharacterized protein LOC108995218 isoform X3 [Juglans regia]KAF5454698.1 hypothetical protein F2P56_024344 [Juglans regia]